MSWAVKVQKCSSDWKTPSDASVASRGRGLSVIGGVKFRLEPESRILGMVEVGGTLL